MADYLTLLNWRCRGSFGSLNVLATRMYFYLT